MFYSTTYFDIESIIVISDLTRINTLKEILDELFVNKNENTKTQILISLCEQLNQMNKEDMDFASSSQFINI